MKSSKFKVQSSKLLAVSAKRWSLVSKFKLFAVLFSLFAVHFSLFTVSAFAQKGGATPDAATPPVTIVAAERNLQIDAGQFNVVLRRSPSDPRAGETGQFLVSIAEAVEGGFGASEPVPLDNAKVSASVTKTDGSAVGENLPAAPLENGNYRLSYAFGSAGDYKIVFNVTTADNRSFSVDFPVSVASAPVKWSFWVGLLVLSLLTLGLLGAVFYAARKRGENRVNYRRIAPFAVAAVLIFVFGIIALTYFLPPRERRTVAEIPLNAPTETKPNALTAAAVLNIPKESQILFGIKTAPVSTRQITSGLKTTGVVRSRPDARAVVVPPVAGRIVLRQGLTIGSAVGRGEQIGSVEQILDVSGQAGLESQRLEVEAQQRDVEARRLELRNTALALQGQQAQQRAAASQAKTRLAQAQRELRRSENLVEVGAAPKRRVEEANTAVRVAEQEVTAADRQVVLLENQIKQAQAGQAIFRAPTVRQPTRSFPLTSPVAGVINEIKATSGQQVETGTQILSIANLSTVLLEAQVFERDLPVVRESTRASFTAAALAGEVYTIGTADGDGRLLSVGQIVNEQTRTVPVIYEIINPLQRLREGMFVEITIDTSGDRQVLAVPKTAVVNEQGQTFVFVFDGGESFEKRPVALGAEGADYFEVSTGLKEGERVVTEGIYQLRSTVPSA
ncbi:MAG TPA: efflux RND transporter periplasmic adaptor subunit [Pyrinomonadaceae bacterium]|nr:efflux RND transporter periplasmic adaptor subunit [Pyrinomonadaceae bacterium]